VRKVALVTGGATGIGAAIVAKLASSGITVVATYNSTIPKEKYENVIYKKLDISSVEDTQQFLKELDKLNLEPNILVNNAGITCDMMFHRMTFEAWKQVIEINLLSLFNLTQPVFKRMRDNKYGRIVCISSVNANKGQVGQVNYCSSKAGVQGFTKALSLEGASHGITVNTVSPGYTQTEMVNNIKPEVLEKIKSTIPMNRLCSVEEVASLVNYLVGDDSGYISGANFEINGGLYFS
jgi:acetoacetyl-CoA reductase